ncbi:mucin-2 isoform X2 [Tachysurus fulvidraco]|uniref:mucin-2 isoform X2 n=1 Tax=Tachysurus fulvidraco TaxID=1234273 RepID=UPI001FF00B5A|nr:mucin-2 isoform X2 [Tachysurus fulvidraco]
MGLRIELEMLAVLLLLIPIASDGLLVPKCYLVDQLMSAIPEDVMNREKLVAELVCHVDMSSHFNTSCIIQGPSRVPPRERKTRGVPTTPKTLNTTTKPPPKSSTLATTKPPPKSSTLATTKPPPKYSTLATTKPPPKSSTLATTKPPPKYSTLATTKPPPKYSTLATTKPPPKSSTLATTKPPPKSSTLATTKPPPKSSTLANTKPPATASNFATTNPPTPKIMHSTPEPKLNQSLEEMLLGANKSATENVMPPPPPPPKFNSSMIMSRKRRGINGQWTLYGLFQVADVIACTSSPPKPTMNLCNLSCNKLIDNDLTDDISCVQSIINYKIPVTGDKDEATRLLRTMKDMLMNSCPTVDYTNYLAECKST